MKKLFIILGVLIAGFLIFKNKDKIIPFFKGLFGGSMKLGKADTIKTSPAGSAYVEETGEFIPKV